MWYLCVRSMWVIVGTDNGDPQDKIPLNNFIKKELNYKSVILNYHPNTSEEKIPLMEILNTI